MKNTLCSALMLICLITGSYAQAEAPKAYFKSNNTLVVDGVENRQGFWTGRFDLGDQFDKDPIARSFYQKHRMWGKWFGILNWGAVVSLIAYSASTDKESYRSGTAAGIFFVPWLGGIYAGVQSGRNLVKAVNVYNGVPASQSLHHNLQDKYDSGILTKMPPVVNLKWNF